MGGVADRVPVALMEDAHHLVEANRLQCLWFMREDYLPRTAEELERTLAQIEAHGDRRAWAEARRIRIWLSQATSAKS